MARSPSRHVGAAVDIGSNSIHLLVARVAAPAAMAERGLKVMRDESELLALGDVVDVRGEMPPESRAEVIAELIGFQSVAAAAGAGRLTVIGSEPLRRSRNSGELAAEVFAATALKLHVVTVREEAELTFLGVTGGHLPREPLIVIDIGGGSTEVCVYTPGEPLAISALPIGSARLTNSFVRSDPPTLAEMDQLQEAASAVRHELPSGPPPGTQRRARAVFVGGTATNVARLGVLTRRALADDRRTLASMTAEQVTVHFGVKPRRARQLAAGAAIVETLLEHYGLDKARASEASLRDGAIIAQFQHGDDWRARLHDLVGPK